jgi:hypothetical protein
MTDEEIDKALERTAGEAPLDPALLKRTADAICLSLQPVRPLPPRWVLSSALVLICVALAVVTAARAGFDGIGKMSPLQAVPILSTLGILEWVAAGALVNQLIPGSRQTLGAPSLLIIVTAALLGVFALAFRDYRTDHLLAAGVGCLLTGVLVAAAAALLSSLLVRRGFALNPLPAGVIGGALAGLCGVTMLELHCSNLLALHVLVWHTAVVPVSAAAGALVAWALGAASTD